MFTLTMANIYIWYNSEKNIRASNEIENFIGKMSRISIGKATLLLFISKRFISLDFRAARKSGPL